MGSRPMQKYQGSCHCGAVRFEIETDFPELTMCDCSICRRKNALMVKVHESSFRLLAGAESLTDVSARAVAALAELSGTGAGTVVVGSHGTFAARALVGLGLAGIDFEFWRRMPMPAVYRVRLEADGVVASGPGLPGLDPAGGASGW